MHRQSNKLNFEGQKVFVGIDVHLKSWNVSIFTEHFHHKTFNAPPAAEALKEYLMHNFPNAEYYSAYEAGFSGLWAHYRLMDLGIHNIVINPSDVPTTHKEKLHKRDAVDSRKIARSLRSNELKGIYTHSIDALQDRSLIRVRSSLVKDLSRNKQRIKSMLYFYGKRIPKEFENCGGHWSKRFILWLKSVEFENETGRQALQFYILQAEQLRSNLLDANRAVRTLSKTDRYCENYRLITSIPGIGITVGMTLLTEIEDIARFPNSDHLAGFIGFVPTCHSSGEDERQGEITPRRHGVLREMLIESSWIAVRKDPALYQAFSSYCKRMNPNKAITRIARKMINRIFFVLKNKKIYERLTV